MLWGSCTQAKRCADIWVQHGAKLISFAGRWNTVSKWLQASLSHAQNKLTCSERCVVISWVRFYVNSLCLLWFCRKLKLHLTSTGSWFKSHSWMKFLLLDSGRTTVFRMYIKASVPQQNHKSPEQNHTNGTWLLEHDGIYRHSKSWVLEETYIYIFFFIILLMKPAAFLQ